LRVKALESGSSPWHTRIMPKSKPKSKGKAKPKRKPAKRQLKEDFAQAAFRALQETIRRSES